MNTFYTEIVIIYFIYYQLLFDSNALLFIRINFDFFFAIVCLCYVFSCMNNNNAHQDNLNM